jgi:hypothetical protein
MLARHPSNDAQHALGHHLDRLVAGQQAAPHLVHGPERTPHRDLPERDALQVAAELGLAQVRVGLERGRGRELAGDDARRLGRARQRAVDDAAQARRLQTVTDGRRLGATQRAQVKAVEMAVEDPVRVLDLGVTDQVKASQGQTLATIRADCRPVRA